MASKQIVNFEDPLRRAIEDGGVVKESSQNEKSDQANRAPASSAVWFLTFEVANRLLAIAVPEVTEIVPMATLSCRPGGVSILAGFLNLGGTVIPVLRMAGFFNAADAPMRAFTPIIIIGRNEDRFGLVADCVQQIIAVSPASIFSLTSRSCCTSAVKLGEKIVPVISIGELLLIEEQTRIAELRESHQRRREGIEQICA